MDMDSAPDSSPVPNEESRSILSILSLAFSVFSMMVCGGSFAGFAIVPTDFGRSAAGTIAIIGAMGLLGSVGSALIAIVLGIIGLVRKEQQRVFSIVGIVIGTVLALTFGCFMAYSLYMHSNPIR